MHRLCHWHTRCVSTLCSLAGSIQCLTLRTSHHKTMTGTYQVTSPENTLDTTNLNLKRAYTLAAYATGRVGVTNDVAQLCLFLADGKKSGFITGQQFTIDGGVSKKLIYPE